jgi:hypothetical protein
MLSLLKHFYLKQSWKFINTSSTMNEQQLMYKALQFYIQLSKSSGTGAMRPLFLRYMKQEL